MQGKLNFTNEVMTLKIQNVVKVVNIVNFNLELLTDFEIVLDIELFYPLWWQAVHNDFGHTQSLPLIANLLV